jgi:sugar/nucleoside kinase (ribokinase family)
MTYDVVTIGAATRDVFVKSTAFEVHETENHAEGPQGCFPLGAKIDIDDIVFETGGGATNAAVTFARLGYSAATITAIGEDASGRDVVEALEREKVATSLVQRYQGQKTAYSVILVAGSGERTVLVFRGASQKIDARSVPWPKVKAKWFYVSSLGGDIELMETILTFAARHDIKVAWNPGAKEIRAGLDELKPLIAKAEIFNLNKEEAAALVGDKDLRRVVGALRSLPGRAAIVTDGLNGAYAAGKRGDILHSDVIDVPRINTTGAGDAFGSGLVAGLLKNDDLPYGLAVGTWNATGVVQQMGAKRGIIRSYPPDEAIKKVTVQPW